MKGVILAGGTGTRLGALTRATNKHLLPLGREPMVYRAIRALDDAGIYEGCDMAVVTGVEHRGAFEGALFPPGTTWPGHLLSQERPGGIAQALEVAREWAEGEPVVMLLADNVWERSLRPWVQAFTRQGHGARALLSISADLDVIRNSGVAVVDSGHIIQVDEKPISAVGAQLIVTGAYAFDATVWDILPTLRPSARGELEITDVLNHYAKRGQLEHDVIDGFWADAGQSIDAYYAAVQFVRCQEAG